MKYIKILMLVVLSSLVFTACDDDKPSSESIFDTNPVERNEFEQWLKKFYTDPYNISFLYRYQDSETNSTYNVAPPQFDKAKAMAILLRHIWIGAYVELMDGDSTFIKTYAPRVFLLTGTRQYKGDGSEVLGTAEGGLKITMFGVNFLDLDNPYVDYTSPFPNRGQNPMDLNYYYFHTLHHEFCHILNQKRNYPEEFQAVSLGHFRSGDWINVRDNIAPAYGFVSGYATSEHREDFAEIYSTYVTHTQEAWDAIVARADELVNDPETYEAENWWEARSVNAPAEIQQKLKIVKDYFWEVWKIDMDKLREIVLRRSKEVADLDLRTLPEK